MKKIAKIDKRYIPLLIVLVISVIFLYLILNKTNEPGKINKKEPDIIFKEKKEEQAHFKNETEEYYPIIKKNKHNEYSYTDYSKADIAALYFQHFKSSYLLDDEFLKKSNVNLKVNNYVFDITSTIKKIYYNDNLDYIIIIDSNNYKYTFNINYVLNYYLEIEKNEE